MDIKFSSNKQRRTFTNPTKLVRTYGKQQAEVIRRRLDDLEEADTLAQISPFRPTRCHELVGNRAGQLSLDLRHPYRLIIEPANEPIPQKDDGGLDRTQVTAIRIIGVEDTHG